MIIIAILLNPSFIVNICITISTGFAVIKLYNKIPLLFTWHIVNTRLIKESRPNS